MAADLRIGELARRVGVTPELLRAWERRYGLLRPERSAGGYRLYSSEDERRVRTMTTAIGRGISAGEAARLALDDGQEAPSPGTLVEALVAFDDVGAHAAIDRLLSTLTLDAVLRDWVLPALHELGERWERGEVTVGQEHFASHLLRGRLLGLARGWDRGSGPRALLACPAGEQHDLPLIAFGLALREHGWRITYLGADTPVATIDETASALRPDLVVLAAVDPARLRPCVEALRDLGSRFPLALAGAGADDALAEEIGTRRLADGPVEAAAAVASG
jgi:MerR family transcriptional regulator, light-induced transcriptional regulator